MGTTGPVRGFPAAALILTLSGAHGVWAAEPPGDRPPLRPLDTEARWGPGKVRALAEEIRRPLPGAWIVPSPDHPVTVTASSFQTWRDRRYVPDNLVDGDYRTAWVENENGTGVGQWVEFSFATPTAGRLHGLVLVPGFARNAGMFANNPRPRALGLSWRCGDMAAEAILRPQDRRGAQAFILPPGWALSPAAPCSLRLTIRGVFPGARFADTSLSEVVLVVAQAAGAD